MPQFIIWALIPKCDLETIEKSGQTSTTLVQLIFYLVPGVCMMHSLLPHWPSYLLSAEDLSLVIIMPSVSKREKKAVGVYCKRRQFQYWMQPLPLAPCYQYRASAISSNSSPGTALILGVGRIWERFNTLLVVHMMPFWALHLAEHYCSQRAILMSYGAVNLLKMHLNSQRYGYEDVSKPGVSV